MRILLTTIILLFNFWIVESWCQSARISLDLKNAHLKELIDSIENQSDYYFIYEDDLFKNNQRLNIKVKNVPIKSVLEELESQINIKANVIEQQVILTKEINQNIYEKADKRVVSGKVVDSSDNPIQGVSIVLEGSGKGTLSDSLGTFQIEVPNGNTTLIFSYVGFVSQEIQIKDEDEFYVVLEEAIIRLQEVVSIGYGTVRKTENTGSISSLKGKTINELPITTLEQGLKGRLTGVQITPSSGQPGAGVSVRIRGVSSIAGGNEPLYVIDGIPTFNMDVRELNGLSGFNPEDISTVEVLKDAIATSIYGSRAANGVILITTKDGIPGKMRVTYNSYFALQKLRKKISLMDGEEYIDYVTKYFTNSQNISEAQKQQNLDAINSFGNANTDWQNEVYRPAFHHGHNFTFSGGNNDNSYFSSLSYKKQEGIVTNTDFTKYAFRLNFNNKIFDWLEITPRTSFSKVVQNGFLAGDGTNTRNNQKSGIGATLLVPPTIGVYDDNGDFSSVAVYPFSYDVMDNPVAMLHAVDRNTMYYFLGGFDADLKLTSGISNTVRLGIEYINRTHDYYLPKELSQLGSQTAELDETKIFGNIFEDFFTLKKTFGHKLTSETVFGFSAQKQNYQNISLSGKGFPSDNLQNNSIQAASSISTPESNRTETTLASFFGRVNMGFHDRYSLSLSIRYDGASVFSESDKWATFPAIGLAWRISEENFISNSKISTLKLRANWGLSGNQAIKPYQSLFVGEIVNTGQGAGSGISVGVSPTLPNKNLTWETTEQYNIGVDYGIFNDRLTFVFDYYIRNTKDLLANVALPGSSGYTYYVDNVGAVQNKGFEFLMGANVLEYNDFLLNLDFNFSKNKNIVKATKNNQDIIPSRTDDATRTQGIVRVGEPLYSFYMPKYVGLDNAGKPIYDDVNNDGLIDDADRQIVGSPYPDFFYGCDINVRYKYFSLTMHWQGIYGAKLNNATLMMLTDPELIANRVKNIKDYYPRNSDDYIVYNSDRFIEDASYMRLKNIKLSYLLLDVYRVIDELEFYISGENLLTFTKYSGYEPEVNSFSDANQFQGVDYAAFPSAKTITVGLNIKF